MCNGVSDEMQNTKERKGFSFTHDKTHLGLIKIYKLQEFEGIMNGGYSLENTLFMVMAKRAIFCKSNGTQLSLFSRNCKHRVLKGMECSLFYRKIEMTNGETLFHLL